MRNKGPGAAAARERERKNFQSRADVPRIMPAGITRSRHAAAAAAAAKALSFEEVKRERVRRGRDAAKIEEI